MKLAWVLFKLFTLVIGMTSFQLVIDWSPGSIRKFLNVGVQVLLLSVEVVIERIEVLYVLLFLLWV